MSASTLVSLFVINHIITSIAASPNPSLYRNDTQPIRLSHSGLLQRHAKRGYSTNDFVDDCIETCSDEFVDWYDVYDGGCDSSCENRVAAACIDLCPTEKCTFDGTIFGVHFSANMSDYSGCQEICSINFKAISGTVGMKQWCNCFCDSVCPKSNTTTYIIIGVVVGVVVVAIIITLICCLNSACPCYHCFANQKRGNNYSDFHQPENPNKLPPYQGQRQP